MTTTIGIKPGDVVLVIERGERQQAYNGLVAGLSMNDALAGTHGEPAIEVCFLAIYADNRFRLEGVSMVRVAGIVHTSHRDFVEGRAALGYEEVAQPNQLPERKGPRRVEIPLQELAQA